MSRLILIAMSVFSFASQAALVESARLDAGRTHLLVEVVYGGGCKPHRFDLQMESCLETYPVQCTVELVDKTKGDYCEAIIRKTVIFSLKRLGLTDPYFNGALLKILGDETSPGKRSSATVSLPIQH
jgi:hypothetical protein